jgi:hypothetical protein
VTCIIQFMRNEGFTLAELAILVQHGLFGPAVYSFTQVLILIVFNIIQIVFMRSMQELRKVKA